MPASVYFFPDGEIGLGAETNSGFYKNQSGRSSIVLFKVRCWPITRAREVRIEWILALANV